MKFDSQSGSKGGKISKRGSMLGVELRGSLYELVDKIINELDYESLNASQKIKLLDVALKYSLPRLSIEKSIKEPEPPREIKITVIGSDGKEKIQSTPLDENFSVKKAFRFE
ncbi:hypothetical protein N9J80_07370 [Flavobacteriaceae bacterium]|nr:hypothetical protein [Flavobacteriaceae bacterium]